MTNLTGKPGTAGRSGLSDRLRQNFLQDDQDNRSDGPPKDPADMLISAAVLAVTAFRLRDEAGLIEALRALADAVGPFETGDVPDIKNESSSPED